MPLVVCYTVLVVERLRVKTWVEYTRTFKTTPTTMMITERDKKTNMNQIELHHKNRLCSPHTNRDYGEGMCWTVGGFTESPECFQTSDATTVQSQAETTTREFWCYSQFF